MSEDSVRERERYAAKEREEVVRRERERRVANIKARQQVMKQIADDRKYVILMLIRLCLYYSSHLYVLCMYIVCVLKS